MIQFAEVQTLWTGDTSPPSISRHHFRRSDLGPWTDSDTGHATNGIRAMWATLTGVFPIGLTLQVQGVTPVRLDQTGELVSDLGGSGGPDPIAGTADLPFTSGSGVRLNWATGAIFHGRHVRGATFLVPAGHTAFGDNGDPTPGTVGAVDGAAATILAFCVAQGLDLVIWSRPTPERVPPKVPRAARTGTTSKVIAGRCGTQPSGLRSRRV